MNNENPTKEFISCAEGFISWVETPPENSKDEAASALMVLTSLYAGALKLMSLDIDRQEGVEPDECRVSPDECKDVYDRLNHLPFTYYQDSDSPLESESESVFVDIVEDLTDIYQDVAEGMKLYKTDQHENALCHWQMTFEYHWGRHCLAAMRALHIWFQTESDFDCFTSNN